MVARKGKTVPAKVPRASGKNIAKYRSQKSTRKGVTSFASDDDSDSSLLSTPESSEDEAVDSDSDSDGTEDGQPELLIRPVNDDESGESGEDDDDDDDDDDDITSDSGSDDDSVVVTSGRIVSRGATPARKINVRKSRDTTPLPVPKKLDLSRIRGRSASADPQSPIGRRDSIATTTTTTTIGSTSGDEDATLLVVNAKQTRRRRRPSIVEHAFDEQATFPRSTRASPSIPDDQDDNAEELDGGDEDDDDDDDDEVDDDNGVESATAATPMSIGAGEDDEGDDFEEASLLALLDQEDDDDSLASMSISDGDAELDEDALEEREERALVEEFKKEEAQGDGERNEDLFSDPSSPVGLDGYEFEEGESEVSFDDDFFEPRETPSRVVMSSVVPDDSTSGDDSYLWSYFFTSGDESEDENDEEARRQGAIVSKPGRFDNDDSGESTDEDLSLPPPSHRKLGARATEVLASSTAGARPPVLGSWDLNDEQRPFSIIDGLTTRTLSPPMLYADIPNSNFYDGKTSAVMAAPSRKRARSQHGFQSDSELSELALDDVIYTDDLDEDDAPGAMAGDVTPVWNRYKNVPLSAFRNRGVHTPVYYHSTNSRRLSSSGGSGRRGSRHAKEAVMTPVRSVKKPSRKHARKKRDIVADIDIDPPGTSDLIDELLEIGAFSPLFNGI
jgi:hypothetical protein